MLSTEAFRRLLARHPSHAICFRLLRVDPWPVAVSVQHGWTGTLVPTKHSHGSSLVDRTTADPFALLVVVQNRAARFFAHGPTAVHIKSMADARDAQCWSTLYAEF